MILPISSLPFINFGKRPLTIGRIEDRDHSS